MKERPILFNGAMVRAILAGEKTQTRRLVKPQPAGNVWQDEDSKEWFSSGHGECGDTALRSPYGQPGDRLWVRETFGFFIDREAIDGQFVELGRDLVYRADGRVRVSTRWTPSIHMPRAASRILLEIVSVRVERLQDISEADALAEGITYHQLPVNPQDSERARTWFRGLWSTINGFESWTANPWVWVVEFRRVQP